MFDYNPQASLYHCPEIQCYNKKKSVPRKANTEFPWVKTDVDMAESLSFRPCGPCFDG